MIIRRHITSNFTIIPNEALLDERLTIGARWLLCYLLSRPQDWQVQIADIQKKAAVGRDKAYALVNELIAVGWVRKDEDRQKDGRWAGVEYVVMDEPAKRETSPFPENPDAAEPQAENPQLTKDLETPKTESTKSTAAEAAMEADFEEFWAAYPKRPNNPRRTALKAYRAARKKKGVTKELLLEAVGRYAAYMTGKQVKFIAHASTWLNDERWGNDYSQSDDVISAYGKIMSGQPIGKPGGINLADPELDISSIIAVYPGAPGDLDDARAAIRAQGSVGEIASIAEAAQKLGLLVKRQRAEGFDRRVPSLAAFIKFQWREFNRAYEFCRVGMNNKLSVRPRKGSAHEDGSRTAG